MGEAVSSRSRLIFAEGLSFTSGLCHAKPYPTIIVRVAHVYISHISRSLALVLVT